MDLKEFLEAAGRVLQRDETSTNTKIQVKKGHINMYKKYTNKLLN